MASDSEQSRLMGGGAGRLRHVIGRTNATIFSHAPIDEKIGEETKDQAEQYRADDKRPDVRPELKMECGEGKRRPVNLRQVSCSTADLLSDPGRCRKNGDKGPGVVDERADENGRFIQSEKADQENGKDNLQPQQRRKGDKNADGKGKGDPVRGVSHTKNRMEPRLDTRHRHALSTRFPSGGESGREN